MIRAAIVTAGLIFCLPSFAKTADAGSHRPLADYVLSADEIRKLSAEDQLIYFNFLNYLIGVVDLSSRASITLDEARSGFRFKLPSSLFSAEAHAAGFLVPVALAGARVAAPHVARALPALQRTWQGFAAAARSRIAGGAEEFISKAASNRRVLIWSTVTAVTGEVMHYATDGKPSEPPVSAAVIEEVQAPAPQAKSAANPAEMSRPGSICLFGGRVSEYKTMSDGQVLCARPRDSADSTTCSGTERTPKFRCENFGLLNAPDSAAIASQLCINLYSRKGLVDLSERCVDAVRKWLSANPPTRLDADKYVVWKAAVTEYLTNYENKTARGETTLAGYCADENKVNRGKQRAECAAINGLIADLKKHTGVEQVIAARATGQVPPAPTGAPPGGGARSTN